MGLWSGLGRAPNMIKYLRTKEEMILLLHWQESLAFTGNKTVRRSRVQSGLGQKPYISKGTRPDGHSSTRAAPPPPPNSPDPKPTGKGIRERAQLPAGWIAGEESGGEF